MTTRIVQRCPTAEELSALTAAVGFKPRDPRAVTLGLSRAVFAACGVDGTETVGCGLVVGDGALHFYLANVMVMPDRQRQGIGSRIVAALCDLVQRVPYRNTLLEVLPLPGLEAFYARFGFRACRQYAPGMHMWIHEQPR